MANRNTLTISLRACLFGGEGDLTDTNHAKLSDLLDDPLLAMDVLGDWVAILNHYRMQAEFSFAGQMRRAAIRAGKADEPTIEDIKEMYDDRGLEYAEAALAIDFDTGCGTNLSDEWHKMLDNGGTKGKVIPFRAEAMFDS